MKKALTPDMLATDIADYLVRKGVPFRETHHISGRSVALAEKLKTPLSNLTYEQFKELDSRFDADVMDLFDYESSVEKRSALGGPSRKGIERQVEVLRKGVAEA